jgi:hypothetical protein
MQGPPDLIAGTLLPENVFGKRMENFSWFCILFFIFLP